MTGNTELIFLFFLFLVLLLVTRIFKITAGHIALLILLVIIGVVMFSDILVCPNCNNNPILRLACRYCGYDGFVSGLEYLNYILS